MPKQPRGGGGEVIAASRWVFTPGVLRINIGQSLSRPWIIRSSNLWQPWIISVRSQLPSARYPPQSLIVAPTDDCLPCHKWQPPWKVSQYWKQIIHPIPMNPINFLALLETMNCYQFSKSLDLLFIPQRVYFLTFLLWDSISTFVFVLSSFVCLLGVVLNHLKWSLYDG